MLGREAVNFQKTLIVLHRIGIRSPRPASRRKAVWRGARDAPADHGGIAEPSRRERFSGAPAGFNRPARRDGVGRGVSVGIRELFLFRFTPLTPPEVGKRLSDVIDLLIQARRLNCIGEESGSFLQLGGGT